MAKVRWTIRAYNTNGNPIACDYTGYSGIGDDAGVTNDVLHAEDREANFYLNGVDDMSFSLYLDDPMAMFMIRARTVCKMWRTIVDDEENILYADAFGEPQFAGILGNTVKDGEANTVRCTFYSPLWRLQSRFHLLNHYLAINPDTSAAYTQSELMWKLIELVNEAFGSESFTGISQGIFALTGDPTMAPFFIQKGQNTWTLIFDVIMNRAAGVDIYPRYSHMDNNPRLMWFDTFERRGSDLTPTVSFDYRIDVDSNLINLNEEQAIVPGEFGNYLWAVGQGGPNSGKIAKEEDSSAMGDGSNAIGVYMVRKDFADIKRVGVAGPPPTHLRAIAEAEFAQARVPHTVYTATLSPASETFFGWHYDVGDLITLNANKGALQVTAVPQRIHTISIHNSANNMEVANPLLSDDFYGSFDDA